MGGIGFELFREHVQAVCQACEHALQTAATAAERFDGIVLYAGSLDRYHADDQAVPFRSTPHFARFAPVPGPDHLLRFRPGEDPRLVVVTPQDYWEEPPSLPEHPLAEGLDVCFAPDLAAASAELGDVSGCALLGGDASLAARLGVRADAVEPPALTAALDWHRAFKTRYEVACIREANRVAARGHLAARDAAREGHSERAIHFAYLQATGALESELPYPTIIAWDDHSAVLHYQRKRASAPDPGHGFLIDAGAQVHGYASDVTRTWLRPGAHPVFREALARMERLQQRLAAAVAPGESFVALHERAVEGVASILCELGVATVGVDELLERGLVLPFLPHGLGHHLGLQVHDVGGQQTTPAGDHRPPPASHPHLRTTRDLDVGHVVTIEPGLYFVPRLLDAHRQGAAAAAFDWRLVDALVPCGGIRIEDDVWVRPDGCENLTRPFLSGGGLLSDPDETPGARP